jgi:heptosyltransferase II
VLCPCALFAYRFDMTRALVIAPQWLGDAIMTEPLLRRLHARGEDITVAALPGIAAIYRAMPQVKAVIELPFGRGSLQLKARRAYAHEQLKSRFDVAYVCPNSLKSALLPFLARIPKRIGYLGEMRLGLLTHWLKNPSRQLRPPMVALYSALANVGTQHPIASSSEQLDILRPQLHLPIEGQLQSLQIWGFNPQSYVVFAPGAEYGPAKRWPTSHFAQLAVRLKLPVVLLGSAKEFELCQSIVNQAHAHQTSQSLCNAGNKPQAVPLNLAGKTSLTAAFTLIANAAQVVSNDSGLMHVAAALTVPQVALFGSSSPEHTPPLSDKAQVIWLKNDPSYQPPLNCAPCFERECPLGHTRCLGDISPAKLEQFLL